jgi:voltage-gated potassium channel
VFTLEYLLRIMVADHKLKFIFSFFGMIDLIAILPFYLTTGLDLRSIRAMRLLRLFRMFKFWISGGRNRKAGPSQVVQPFQR